MSPAPRPIRFAPPAPSDPLADYWRGALVTCLAAIEPRRTPEIAERLYGRDAETVLRAVSVPASTTGAGWAAPLAGVGYGPFLSGIAPRSAGAQLAALALQVSLAGVGVVQLPGFIQHFPQPPWIAEGQPFPIVMAQLGDVPIGPERKLAFGAVLTGELSRFTAATAEGIVKTGLTEAAALALDSAMLSSDPATATQPAGILAGVAPLPAAVGGGVAAMSADLAAMAGAIASHGGGAQLAVVAALPQATSMALLAPASGLIVIASAALDPGVIAMVDVAALATAFDAVPRLEASKETTVHMEGATPLPIASPGSPPSVAAPSRSLFQTDSIGIRAIWPAAWSIRDAGLVAWIEGTTW